MNETTLGYGKLLHCGHHVTFMVITVTPPMPDPAWVQQLPNDCPMNT